MISPVRRIFPKILPAAVATALFLGGCGGQEDFSSQPSTFIFARGSDAQKLDPADVDDGESVNTVTQICEGLVRFKSGTLEIEPCLASRYEISPDGLTYTFYLREGVAFHDGTPLNAETAIWSFQRQMDPDHPGHLPDASFQYWNNLYQDVAEVRAVDAMTVEFTLSQPNASLLASLAIFPAFLISPKALADHPNDFARFPVGTGPYKFVRWSPNEAIVMTANHDYWDASSKPQFDRLVLKVVPENSVRLLELKSGRIHGLDGVHPAEVASLESDPRFTVYKDAGLNVGYLTFNLHHQRYQDPEVRLAFAMAIDRDKLAALALEGSGRAAHYPVPPAFLGYPKNPDVIPHDPERAREILSRHASDFEAPVRIQVMSAARPYLPDPVRAASFIRSELENVGLKVEIVARDFKTHLNDLRNFDFDIAVIGWVGDNGDPDNFLSVFFASWATDPGSASNYADYRNAEMDRLLLAARVETVSEKRGELYEQALALWRNDLPIIPLVHGDNIAVLRSEVTGFRIQKISDIRLGTIGWNSAGTP